MDPRNALLPLMYRLPIELSRRALFTYYVRAFPRFSRPVTFNEKVNWRILNDRRPLLEWTCDKLAMKEYAEKFGIVRIPETKWVGTGVRELAGAELSGHWVLKPNNRSGAIFFGHGKPDIESLVSATGDWFKSFEARNLHEWAYSKARPLILAEELLGVPGSPPPDYKFFVFAGEVAAVQVDVDRHTAHKRRLYLPDWTPLEVSYGKYPLAPIEPVPVNLDKMIAAASTVGGSFDFIRVDLYNIDGDIFFGELTPYATSGLDRFVPREFDAELGAKWKLPLLPSD